MMPAAKPCDCAHRSDRSQAADSIRMAAALWVSAGKTDGWAEGVRWAVGELLDALPLIAESLDPLARPEHGRVPTEPLKALHTLVERMRNEADGRLAQSAGLQRAATAMVTRLEHQYRTVPRLRTRIRNALIALRGW